MTPLEHATGAWTPGITGSAFHEGEPLTVEQINALHEGQRVVVTWTGGNGPHEYEVVHDPHFGVSVRSGNRVDPLLTWPDQKRPLNRVTLREGEK